MTDTEEHDKLEEEISKFTFHLFAIGINSYKYHRNLKTAERGAIDISDVLVERYGFDRSNVICLLGDQATADAIDRQLRKYAKTLKPTDALVMFYAGHGEYDEAFTDGTYLIPHDAGKDSTALWIDHDKISRYFGSIKARHILLISDSCFSGGALRWIEDEEPNVEFAYAIKAIKRASRQVITSGGLETVQDRGFGGHSVFSHFLIDYLKTAEGRFIGPTDIFQSIMDAVAKNSSQSPDNGRLSQSGDARGFFCLRNTDFSDEHAETLTPPDENVTEIGQSSSLKRKISSKASYVTIIAMLMGLSLLALTFFVVPKFLQPDSRQAYENSRESCASGDQHGCYKTAMALIKGDGVSKDVSHGISILEVGCAGNFSTSCMQLGFLYERGNEITKDIGKATEYFRKSCTAGKNWGCSKLQSMNDQN